MIISQCINDITLKSPQTGNFLTENMVRFFKKFLKISFINSRLVFFYLDICSRAMRQNLSKRRRFTHRINYYSKTNRETADLVFEKFENPTYGMLTEIHRDFSIPIQTVSDWYKQYQNDPEWRPYLGKYHGLHHRIFTDAEEESIKNYIMENFVKPGKLFTNADFRDIAMNAFLEKHKDSETIPDFQISNQFIDDFKERNHIASRLAHPKRRSDNDPQRDIEWEKSIKNLLNDFPRDRILNCDETSWQVFPNSLKTWAEKGSQNVQIQINGNVKESVTALATIAADGTKCPLFLIAKGLTERCEESQLGDTSYHFRTHSANGWSTTDTFQEYLHFISDLYHGQPLHLLLDLHSSHRSNEIKKLAAELNITLHYIPAGQTDKYQPLDRKVFGALKATARHLIRERLSENSEFQFTKQNSVSDLICSWEQLTVDTVLDSWDFYEMEIEL